MISLLLKISCWGSQIQYNLDQHTQTCGMVPVSSKLSQEHCSNPCAGRDHSFLRSHVTWMSSSACWSSPSNWMLTFFQAAFRALLKNCFGLSLQVFFFPWHLSHSQQIFTSICCSLGLHYHIIPPKIQLWFSMSSWIGWKQELKTDVTNMAWSLIQEKYNKHWFIIMSIFMSYIKITAIHILVFTFKEHYN